MKPLLLFAVVVVQVLVFQLGAIHLGRVIPAFMLGRAELPPELAAKRDAFQRGIGRSRRIIALVLLATATLMTFAGSLARSERKLALAVVSLVSTAAFVAAYVIDYRAAAAIAGEAPDSGLRLATLEPRSLSRYYRKGWELLPVLVLLATVSFTLGRGVLAGPGRAVERPWVVPVVQLVVYGFLTWLTVFLAHSRGCLAPRARSSMGNAEKALEIEQRLRVREVRDLFAAKTMALLLLATMQLGRVLSAGAGAASWPGAVQWAVVLLFLALFASFIWRVARMRGLADS